MREKSCGQRIDAVRTSAIPKIHPAKDTQQTRGLPQPDKEVNR